MEPTFYSRPVVEVARDLIGCTVSHAGARGVIVETEAYHQSETACHAHVGLTPRTHILFGPPGRAYVYRSYGIHWCANLVCSRAGMGAAVLLRAMFPTGGVETIQKRRGEVRPWDLANGPGKLTAALGMTRAHDQQPMRASEVVVRSGIVVPDEEIRVTPRIGITKAVDWPLRYLWTRSS